MSFLAALVVEFQSLLSKQGNFKPKKMCRSLPHTKTTSSTPNPKRCPVPCHTPQLLPPTPHPLNPNHPMPPPTLPPISFLPLLILPSQLLPKPLIPRQPIR